MVTPERRNTHHQREEDLAKDIALWAFWLTKKRGRLMAAIGIISSLATLFTTTVAMRIVDPRQEIKPLQDSIRVISAQMQEAKRDLTVGKAERAEIREDLRWVRYMMCDERKERHPGRFLPPVCSKP